jgi:glyoxylase-like metal-dependent hydrolase (beta-lactamase superfamily II)
MEKVQIRNEDVVGMDAIAPGLHGLRIAFVNVFGVEHPDGEWTLVDAALPYSAGIIQRWAKKMFVRPPRAIVLTHGHFDHVSAATELCQEWGVPVFAHRLEFPYLTGEREYPKPNVGAGGGMMSLLSPLYPRGPTDLRPRLRDLGTEDEQSGVLPGWSLLETPGHTPGHVSFWRQSERLLLPGDAFCTTKPESFFEAALAQQPELHGPPAYFTSDWGSAGAAVRKLAALNADIVAPGHGRPMAGAGVAESIRDLAERFGEVAVPENVKHEAA